MPTAWDNYNNNSFWDNLVQLLSMADWDIRQRAAKAAQPADEPKQFVPTKRELEAIVYRHFNHEWEYRFDYQVLNQSSSMERSHLRIDDSRVEEISMILGAERVGRIHDVVRANWEPKFAELRECPGCSRLAMRDDNCMFCNEPDPNAKSDETSAAEPRESDE